MLIGGKVRNVYKILLGKCKGKWPLRRSRTYVGTIICKKQVTICVFVLCTHREHNYSQCLTNGISCKAAWHQISWALCTYPALLPETETHSSCSNSCNDTKQRRSEWVSLLGRYLPRCTKELVQQKAGNAGLNKTDADSNFIFWSNKGKG